MANLLLLISVFIFFFLSFTSGRSFGITGSASFGSSSSSDSSGERSSFFSSQKKSNTNGLNSQQISPLTIVSSSYSYVRQKLNPTASNNNKPSTFSSFFSSTTTSDESKVFSIPSINISESFKNHQISFNNKKKYIKNKSNSKSGLSSLIGKFTDEIKYRKLSLTQYRDQIRSHLINISDNFKFEQALTSFQAQRILDIYTKQFNQVYSDTLNTLQKQREAIDELNQLQSKSNNFIRPHQIDESLEQFKKFYNESIAINSGIFNFNNDNNNNNNRGEKSKFDILDIKPITLKSKVKTNWFNKLRNKKNNKIPFQFQSNTYSNTQETELFSKQIEKLNKNLQTSWDTISNSVADGSESAEKSIRNLFFEFAKLQEDVASTAWKITKKSQDSIQISVDKTLVRKELDLLEDNLKKLEKVGHFWLDERIQELETTLKVLQDKVSITNSMYDELIVKRRASMQYTSMNDATLSKVLRLIEPKDREKQGWKLMKEEDGFEVYRKFMPIGMPGSQYACVLCHGVINSTPESVVDLIADNTRVPEYNSFYASGRDLEVVADNTKVTWVGSPPVFPFKARDFVTVIHIRKLKDGTTVILNRATSHPDAPVTSEYVRGAIVLAANIIQPVPGNPKKCKLTMLTQMDPGGFAPPVLINHICTLGPIGFLKNVDSAANKKPSQKDLEERRKKALQMKY